MDYCSSFIPTYDFSTDANQKVLQQVLPLLERHQIAANPINYAICYDYIVGSNTGLRKVVSDLLKENKPLDRSTSLEIYSTHICSATLASFEKLNASLRQVLDQASNAISDTCSKAEETNDSFQKKSQILQSLSTRSDINSLLQEIITETHALAATSQTMQSRLLDANRELSQLRTELDQMRQIAVTDSLTGLLNRRAFDQTLNEVLAHFSEAESTFLALLDIDRFKRINDTYGHTIGDSVIRFAASLMRQYAQSHHHTARYGGEELAIIMPGTSRDDALAICENIRATLEKSRLKRKNDQQPLGVITVSIGLAELQAGDDSESFIDRADKALYTAKTSGRNKIVI
ncbi:GGDEF domain-containing protein [Methylomonas sp. HYX-M1]|uniref:GGDEF domain-containing protein n=1 Tax=Methylomonas sp. HYX-M1 TaxID=3139307 RepID=UPI00345B8858